jgi:hypothetical protein
MRALDRPIPFLGGPLMPRFILITGRLHRLWLWFLDLTPIEAGVLLGFIAARLPWPGPVLIAVAFLMCLNFGVNWKHGREWGQRWEKRKDP